MAQRPQSIREQFGELRSLLHRGHSPAHWKQLTQLLDMWEHHEELEAVGLPYVQALLSRWPDELRASPAKWLERKLSADELNPDEFPQWQVVRTIDFHGQLFGHMTWRRIGRELVGEELVSIRARGLPLLQRELELLLEPKNMLQLRHLDLTYCTLTSESIELLATHAHVQNLTKLDLGECKLGHTGVQLLCISPYLTKLESIKLQNARIGAGVVPSLTRAEFADQLRVLDLSDNYLGTRGAALLGQPHVWKSLESLRVKNCGLGPDGVRALFEHPHAFPKLRSLNLEYNDIQGQGLRHLVNSPVISQLRSLNLGYNKIGGDGLKILLHDKRASDLKQLAVHWNPVSATAQEVLDASPYLDKDELKLLT